jgi:hypothetical protein
MDNAKLRQMFEEAKAGKIFFTKAPSGWMIIGAADKIQKDAIVDVTKADGTTKAVRVTRIDSTHTREGFTYSVAEFGKTATEIEAEQLARANRRDGYTVVQNAAFGPGRRYHSQPGATQYDDGSGTYSVQIWDNA